MRNLIQWKCIEKWVRGLHSVQLILYIDEIRKLRDDGLFRDSIFWCDSAKFLDMLYIEFVNRFRQQVGDEFSTERERE